MRLSRLLGRLLLAGALGVVSSTVWSWSKVTYYAEATFQPNSVEIGGAQLDALETMLCRFGSNRIDVAVVNGHAASNERNPSLIALQRTLRIREWLMANAGWTAGQIYVEGKGATQPVADPRTNEGRARNRHVEIELVPASRDGRSWRSVCRPAWQDQLFSLGGESAMVMARALVRSGRVSTDALLFASLKAKRLDLFEELVNPRSGLRFDFKTSTGALTNLFVVACEGSSGQSRADDKALAALIANVHGKGLVVRDDKALACAVWLKSPVLADAFLDAGATRFLTPNDVVDAGRAPPVLERLLARGADPRARTAAGTTLFHTMRLNTAADVRRLLDWGLDINAEGPTYPSNPKTTPLREAVSYASVEVLDAMKQAGARVEDAGPLQLAHGNPEAQVWLLRNGLPIADERATVIQIARQQKGVVLVLSALRERGVDVSVNSASGQDALGIAIGRYEPDVVRFLVEAGVGSGDSGSDRARALIAALDAAQDLAVMKRHLVTVVSGVESSPKPAPSFDPDLQQRKDQIIDILKKHLQSRSTS